jgi:hypothetical protein
LTVTAKGVGFRADQPEDNAKDGFTFAFGQFASSLAGDELTIKASEKTYRFKATDAGGKDDGRARLQALAARIARGRAGSKPPSRP